MSRQLAAFEVPILSARTGENAGLFRDALTLYLPDGATIADPTYGRGGFWRSIENGRFNVIATDLADGGPDLSDLPYTSASLDAIVLDPPYIPSHDDDLKDSIDASYRVNTSGLRSANEIIDCYEEGLYEASRVLVDGGLAFVKCQDTCENHTQFWVHVEIWLVARAMDWVTEDLFILIQRGAPAQRHRSQEHARKNHSYLWVFRRPRRASLASATRGSAAPQKDSP